MAKPAKKSGGGGLLLVLGVLAALAYSQNGAASAAAAPPAGSGVYVAPADGRLTSGYGPRRGKTHGGIDIAAPTGTAIRAVTDAIVTEVGPASGFGLWIRLTHPDGTVTVYGHMHTIDVDKGAAVAAGQQIATVGSRGRSTGPHLHFEVWPGGDRAQRVDPQPWLADHGVHL